MSPVGHFYLIMVDGKFTGSTLRGENASKLNRCLFGRQYEIYEILIDLVYLILPKLYCDIMESSSSSGAIQPYTILAKKDAIPPYFENLTVGDRNSERVKFFNFNQKKKLNKVNHDIYKLRIALFCALALGLTSFWVKFGI